MESSRLDLPPGLLYLHDLPCIMHAVDHLAHKKISDTRSTFDTTENEQTFMIEDAGEGRIQKNARCVLSPECALSVWSSGFGRARFAGLEFAQATLVDEPMRPRIAHGACPNKNAGLRLDDGERVCTGSRVCHHSCLFRLGLPDVHFVGQ